MVTSHNTALRRWHRHLGLRPCFLHRSMLQINPLSGGACASQLQRQRQFSAGSGQKTLKAVVQELHRQGRLPLESGGTHAGEEAETAGSPGIKHAGGVIDIDLDLMAATCAGVDETFEDTADHPDKHTEGAVEEDDDMDQYEEEDGLDEEDEEAEVSALRLEGFDSERDEGSMYAGASAYDNTASEDPDPEEESFEDLAKLTEDQLRDKVRRSIEELVPSEMASGDQAPSKAGLSPAQLFYMENKEALIQRAQDYYIEKHQELAQQEGDLIEDEWRFYQDPVVRPRKGHLWATGEEEDGEGDAHEQDWLTIVEGSWTMGEMPTPEMLADLLRREQAKDVNVVNLHEVERHDVGTHAIVATGITTGHCRRLGTIAVRAIQWCQVPYVQAFTYGTRHEEWVVAHLGPYRVHVFTRDAREEYNLELLWAKPEEFFEPDDFPHYMEHFGAAIEGSEDGYLVKSRGLRKGHMLPVPGRDGLQERLMDADYSAADDVKLLSAGAGVSDRPQQRSEETESDENATGATASSNP